MCYVTAQVTNNPCEVEFITSGYTYDISGAYNPKQDYSIKDQTGNTYYLNPCHNTIYPCDTPTPVCQLDSASRSHSLGTLNSSLNNPSAWQEFVNGAGFTVQYYSGDNGRTVILAYICSNATTPVLTFAGENPALNYHINIHTSYACPVNSTTNATVCCLYDNAKNASDYRTLCTTDGECPMISGWENSSNWNVNTCNSCFFHHAEAASTEHKKPKKHILNA